VFFDIVTKMAINSFASCPIGLIDSLKIWHSPSRSSSQYCVSSFKEPCRLIIVNAPDDGVVFGGIQCLFGYLHFSSIEHGLLINFGSPKLEIRKFELSE